MCRGRNYILSKCPEMVTEQQFNECTVNFYHCIMNDWTWINRGEDQMELKNHCYFVSLQ